MRRFYRPAAIYVDGDSDVATIVNAKEPYLTSLSRSPLTGHTRALALARAAQVSAYRTIVATEREREREREPTTSALRVLLIRRV